MQQPGVIEVTCQYCNGKFDAIRGSQAQRASLCPSPVCHERYEKKSKSNATRETITRMSEPLEEDTEEGIYNALDDILERLDAIQNALRLADYEIAPTFASFASGNIHLLRYWFNKENEQRQAEIDKLSGQQTASGGGAQSGTRAA